ncbi:MAG: guanylate kinase [Firmicutes bacterium]|nr:guanylate kinase [Bacillota bacterium]
MSAPSGAGKGTLRRALLDRRRDIVFCPSVTTRKPRPGEIPGGDYLFVSEDEFERKVRAGELIEWARVYDHLYGTPGAALESLLDGGYTVLVEKDVQGAKALRSRYPDAVYVFVLPPSFEELKKRVERRGTESPGEVGVRLQSYAEELRQVGHYDYVIVNDDLDTAERKLEAIITAERCRVSRNLGRLDVAAKEAEAAGVLSTSGRVDEKGRF